MVTKRQRIDVLMDNGMKFKEACSLLGFDPHDPELIDVPDFLMDIFGGKTSECCGAGVYHENGKTICNNCKSSCDINH